MQKFEKGFLEEITPSWQLDDMEDTIKVFNECWKNYDKYLRENSSRFSDEVLSFVDSVVLGKVVSKRLHDDLVIGISAFFKEKSGDAVKINIKIKLESHSELRSLDLCYENVTAWDFPNGEDYYLIDRHEVIEVAEGYQHMIYIVGSNPIRIVFRNLSMGTN